MPKRQDGPWDKRVRMVIALVGASAGLAESPLAASDQPSEGTDMGRPACAEPASKRPPAEVSSLRPGGVAHPTGRHLCGESLQRKRSRHSRGFVVTGSRTWSRIVDRFYPNAQAVTRADRVHDRQVWVST